MDENNKSRDLNKRVVIEEFELGSSANVAIIEKALKKGIIDIAGKDITFANPIMPHWLQAYFKW